MQAPTEAGARQRQANLDCKDRQGDRRHTSCAIKFTEYAPGRPRKCCTLVITALSSGGSNPIVLFGVLAGTFHPFLGTISWLSR